MKKREFLKYCGLGFCGIAGLKTGHHFFAEPFMKWNGSVLQGGGKWIKEAEYYDKIQGRAQCRKCPHLCLLGENDSGICRNRVNRKGTLYSIAYGNPCAVHVDPIEKKPLFHFLPSTRAFSLAVAGCNFRCLNCQNWQISQFSPDETENYDLNPEQVVDECRKSGCESIAYTYSEPTTFYEYAVDIASLAKKANIRNVLKSNGYINEQPLRRLCRVLDAANIDLKVYDDKTYNKLSGGELKHVLRSLQILKEEGVWLEITNLVIPGWTDDMEVIKRMCDWIVESGLDDCPLHFSRFTPMYKMTQLPITPVPVLESARDAARQSGIKYVYIGNVPSHQAENTYCHRCKKMIVERKGYTILKKNISRSVCEFCGEKIPGIWT